MDELPIGTVLVLNDTERTHRIGLPGDAWPWLYFKGGDGRWYSVNIGLEGHRDFPDRAKDNTGHSDVMYWKNDKEAMEAAGPPMFRVIKPGPEPEQPTSLYRDAGDHLLDREGLQ